DKAKDRDKDKPEARLSSGTLAGFKFRPLGPATYSGRIVDIAIHPSDLDTWYLAVACGHVWKTSNHGITWKPMLEDKGTYSFGCVTIDPNDPLTVWVGSGENNSQRSVGYGNGVYRSRDGGESWTNMGLPNSEHIGMIAVDPRDSKVVWVAAMGPLWNSGGDRGLYQTTDGGDTWKRVLEIDENTGVNEVHLDPSNPDVVYACAYQRGRRVWTLVNGGPGSGFHKSTDGGKSWTKLSNGLPKEEMGRLGMTLSPRNPRHLTMLVEAANAAGGTFTSDDGGINWKKVNPYTAGGAQYYQELISDPNDEERIYSMDTFLQVTDDGGRNWRRAGERFKHVDNHAIWIDPNDSDHLLVGCDGGLYETYDRCETFGFFGNLPITQLYKIAVDNALPFYNVYGGTQDNYSFGGPSRTNNVHGIANSDWFVTQGGDGFQTQVDPSDHNIIYAQAQHGELTRYDRRSGENVDIQPQPEAGQETPRWNWDSPLLISPHLGTRLYFAANRLYRSDDRGDSWRPVSEDLTRQLDRDTLPLMGRTWSIDAVARHGSTSHFGNIVALSESPRVEGLLYAGTDDGLIQVSENGGGEWRKIESVGDVPGMTYVSRLVASQHQEDRAYAAFNNMKMGDFKPYLFRSDDRGRSWRSVRGDLPERGGVWSLVEDPVREDLLFCGTELGVFVTFDGGGHWLPMTGGLPNIAMRDLVIQERENDLVVGTFGRGFYVLDDISPLRSLSEEALSAEGNTFPVRPALMYFPSSPLGLRDKAFQGETYFNAANPPFGAVLTWYLRDERKSMKKLRQEIEKTLAKESKPIPRPTWEGLTAESREEDPFVLITIKDAGGQIVRRLRGPAGSGIQRLAWDLRGPAPDPVSLTPPSTDNPFSSPPAGPIVLPGTYRAAFATVALGTVTPFGQEQVIECRPLNTATLATADPKALSDFRLMTARLQRAVLGATQAIGEAQPRLDHLKKALTETPAADPAWVAEASALDNRMKDIRVRMSGDPVKSAKNYPQPPSISSRVNRIIEGQWNASAAPTGTLRANYSIAAAEFEVALGDLRQLIEVDLVALEARAEKAGAPWTPGRLPTWSRE
ncbi:MAG: glycosyl hydrolase, partial [Candidatus Eisenbacteria bacterium]|nr:glycosyl hydrolase [Candidatus Eisenbacteria bacterium]